MNNPITAHLDLWTAAIKRKSSAGRGSSKKIELYGIKKLRELILELAVRGLLVPQDPNDEPASELLKKIAAEKARLVKEGKIKKEKPLPPVAEAEKPFEIPNGWAWALLPQICNYGTGKTPSTKNSLYWEDSEAGVPWVSIADMEHLKTIVSTTKRVSNKAVEEVFRGPPVPAGTMIMSFKLTLGKISKLGVASYHNEAIIALYPYSGILEDYVFNFLPGRALTGNSKAAIKGSTLNSESLAALLMPLPPLAEQHRIVAKVDELMALCDQLEQQTEASLDAHQTLVETLLHALTNPPLQKGGRGDSWQRIATHFDTLFTTEQSIDQLKQTILQLAVMGKLVPQDPNDEPASELLKKIAAEKARLVKEGKIKKEKPLPPIAEAEKPFALPEGWEWVRLSHVASFENGDRSSRYPNSNDIVSEGIPFFGAPDITEGKLSFGKELRFITEEKFNELSNGKLMHRDFVVILRGSVGKTAQFIASDEHTTGFINAQMLIIRLALKIMDSFVDVFFKSSIFHESISDSKSGAVIQQLPASKVAEIPFPLPPLAEQHRIVAKVDQLMALCDQLKARLSHAQTTQLQLADALAEQALN